MGISKAKRWNLSLSGGGDQPLSPKAEKLGYGFLPLQAADSLPLSCHRLHLSSKRESFSPLHSHFFFSLIGLVWYFCFVLPGKCHNFLRLFLLPNPYVSPSIIVPLFKLLASSIPLTTCPFAYRPIAFLSAVSLLGSVHSLYVHFLFSNSWLGYSSSAAISLLYISFSHTHRPTSGLGQCYWYCQIEALYSIPYRFLFPWCCFQSGFLLFAILIYSVPSCLLWFLRISLNSTSHFLCAYYVPGTGCSRPGRFECDSVCSSAKPSPVTTSLPCLMTLHTKVLFSRKLSGCMPTCHPAQMLVPARFVAIVLLNSL